MDYSVHLLFYGVCWKRADEEPRKYYLLPMIDYIYLRWVMKAWTRFWRDMFDFKGKTTRREYCATVLMQGVIQNLLVVLCGVLGLTYPFWNSLFELLIRSAVVSLVYSLLILIAMTSMNVRRLNDAGYCWKSYVWLLIPVLGGFAFLARIFEKSAEPLPKKPKI